jgi:hypothetical protein
VVRQINGPGFGFVPRLPFMLGSFIAAGALLANGRPAGLGSLPAGQPGLGRWPMLTEQAERPRNWRASVAASQRV